MVKRVILGLIGLLLAYFSVSFVSSYLRAPERQVKQVALTFWTAVVAGDEAQVQALLAPDATRTAAEWIDAHRGLPLLSEEISLIEIGENTCGVAWVAIATLRTPEGNPTSRTASMKLVNGDWRIRTPEGALC